MKKTLSIVLLVTIVCLVFGVYTVFFGINSDVIGANEFSNNNSSSNITDGLSSFGDDFSSFGGDVSSFGDDFFSDIFTGSELEEGSESNNYNVKNNNGSSIAKNEDTIHKYKNGSLYKGFNVSSYKNCYGYLSSEIADIFPNNPWGRLEAAKLIKAVDDANFDLTDRYVLCVCGRFKPVGKVTKPLPDGALCLNNHSITLSHVKFSNTLSYKYVYDLWIKKTRFNKKVHNSTWYLNNSTGNTSSNTKNKEYIKSDTKPN